MLSLLPLHIAKPAQQNIIKYGIAADDYSGAHLAMPPGNQVIFQQNDYKTAKAPECKLLPHQPSQLFGFPSWEAHHLFQLGVLLHHHPYPVILQPYKLNTIFQCKLKIKSGHCRGWEILYLMIVYGMPESAKYCSALRFHTKIFPFPMLLRGWLTSVPPIDPISTICFTPASLAAQINKDN